MQSLPTELFNLIKSSDKDQRYDAYRTLSEITDNPVNWAYEVWDDLLKMTAEGDNHQRTIAVQLLSNLAKSDPEKRMVKDFPLLLKVTRDEKFVTARHSLQSLWKIGIVNAENQARVVEGLKQRFADCAAEKNCTLIRYDIIQVLRTMYDATGDAQLRETALALTEAEDDKKYRKKYLSLWKDIK